MQPEKTGNSPPATRVNSLWEGPPSEDGSMESLLSPVPSFLMKRARKPTKEDRLMVCACVPFPGKERNTEGLSVTGEDVALSLRLAHSVP